MLLAALEHAWAAIQARHPDLPAAQIVIGAGSGQRGGLLLGHLAPDRWQPADGRGERVHELLIAGEGLARGAVDVFTTVLHEAAHALALARGVADTSRDGRYHNHRYQQLAGEVGLSVDRDAHSGWSATTLTPATRARYQPAIDELAGVITLHRLREPAPTRRRNLPVAVCGCPRRIRVAPSTLSAGAITCAICGEPFTPASQPPGRTASDPGRTVTPPRKRASPRTQAPAPRPAAALVKADPFAPFKPNSGSRLAAGTARVRRNWPGAERPLKAAPGSADANGRVRLRRTALHRATKETNAMPTENHHRDDDDVDDDIDAPPDWWRCNRLNPCGEPDCVACQTPQLECTDGPHGCRGDVLYRWPGYGDRQWPRCELHGELRLEREEAAMERYPDLGPPADFDPDYAGERWEAD